MHPETPLQGRTLQDLFAGRGVDIPQMLARLEQTADQLGLPFGPRTMTYNSRRAQELGKWAEDQGAGGRFHHGVFNAYFANGQNIAQWEVLQDIAVSAGLDGNDALRVAKNGSYRDRVDGDWERARQMAIHAVPAFQMNGRILVGAQPYGALEDFIKSAAQ